MFLSDLFLFSLVVEVISFLKKRFDLFLDALFCTIFSKVEETVRL